MGRTINPVVWDQWRERLAAVVLAMYQELYDVEGEALAPASARTSGLSNTRNRSAPTESKNAGTKPTANSAAEPQEDVLKPDEMPYGGHVRLPFARGLMIRIAEYAKGRKLVAADFATVELLLDNAAKNDFKFQDIVLSLEESDLITHRGSVEGPAGLA